METRKSSAGGEVGPYSPPSKEARRRDLRLLDISCNSGNSLGSTWWFMNMGLFIEHNRQKEKKNTVKTAYLSLL